MKIQEDGKLVIQAEKDIFEMSQVKEPNEQEDDSNAPDVDLELQAAMKHFLQLFCPSEDREKGVYSGNLCDCKILSCKITIIK